MASILANNGRAIITNRIHGAGTEPLNIGVGTGAGTAGVTDTTLFTEANTTFGATGTRISGTGSQQTTSVTNDTYRVTGTFTALSSGTVTNAGLFDSTAIAATGLFLKGDFAGIGLASSDSIAFTFNIQFS